MSEREKWEAYLDRFVKAFNALPEVPPLLKNIAPLLFQYEITDRPEMSFWELIEEDKMNWGMGKYQGARVVPTIFHKTDFETIKKVNSGEIDPIQATMSGKYTVEGDVGKLMACAPLLPLNPKAHAASQK